MHPDQPREPPSPEAESQDEDADALLDAIPARSLPTIPNVLIAEDRFTLRHVLRHQLEKMPCRVFEAGSGEEALQIMAEEKIDVMLLDWMLPGMQGPEVCRRLRQQGHQLPIIMLTARGTKDNVIEAVKAGATAYVVKPFRVQQVVDKIREVTGTT